ncbi:hypothetical protein GQ53DRAFT_744711 [Thozetella sp. PMI_491]|nr:hypothetical protein GQ53DRAFT_744711 [Thozetella sp. PMI_491]
MTTLSQEAGRSPAPSGLLKLSLELRQQIIHDVVFNYTEPPTTPEGAQYDRSVLRHSYGVFPARDQYIGHEKVCYNHPQNPVLALLLANRQLYVETKDVLRLLERQLPDYSVDVMFVKNVGIWLSWTSVPWLSSKIGTLHATLRVVESHSSFTGPLPYNRNMWRRGCGGPPSGVWYFYDALLGFLDKQVRPWPPREEESESMADQITLQKLVLDVQSPGSDVTFPLAPEVRAVGYRKPAEPTGEDYFSYWSADEERSTGDRFYSFVSSEIGRLSKYTFRYDIYGRILYERIGEIQMWLDGKQRGQVDLSVGLEESAKVARSWSWSREQEAELVEWLARTYKERTKAGMPVPRDTLRV